MLATAADPVLGSLVVGCVDNKLLGGCIIRRLQGTMPTEKVLWSACAPAPGNTNTDSLVAGTLVACKAYGANRQ